MVRKGYIEGVDCLILSNSTIRRHEELPRSVAFYCPRLQLTVIDVEGTITPVVLLQDYAGVRTKKQDIEKGDDLKDRPNPPKPKPN